MALLTGPASASQRRVLTGSFGGESSRTVDPYPLSGSDLCEGESRFCQKYIAVDTSTGHPSSGDVYVADPNNHRVEKFDASGNFILMFGKNVNQTKVGEGSSTEAERNVCTAVSGDECQQGTSGTGPGAFVSNPMAIAVDSSSGSSAGNVYVANTTKRSLRGSIGTKGQAVGEGTITRFGEDGKIVSSWGVGGQMQGSSRPFGALGGVTVDPSGNLWVYGTTERAEEASKEVDFIPEPLVFELAPDGSLLTSWQPSKQQPVGSGIAIDTEHHVYLDEGSNSIFKYDGSNGNLLGNFAQGQYLTSDLGAHTIDVKNEQAVDFFEATCPGSNFVGGCPQVEAFNPSRPHNWGPLAVNYTEPSDTIYVEEEQREIAKEAIATVPDVTTLPAAPVSTSAATLKGTVDPEGVAIKACFFEWGEGEGAYEHTAPCEVPSATEIGTGGTFVPVQAQISIQAGKAYHFRLVAANAQDAEEPVQGADIVLGPPRVDSTSVSDVTASSATFHAEVNPRNLDTKYHLEYLTEAEFDENGESFSGPRPATSVPLTDGDVGSGQQDVTVSQHVAGLLLHTVYRYRVIARNILGEGADAVVGPAETVVTWGTGEFGLPDGRQWEMVSPPDKHGALVEPIGAEWVIQAAAGGGRMAYVTRAPSEANPAGYTVIQSSLATRGARGGWSSRDIALPHVSATGVPVGLGYEYRLFSEDLARAVVQPFGAFVPCESEQGVAQPCLSAEASEQTPFLASEHAVGASSEPCTGSCYTPLVTGAEGFANVPSETVFGQKSVFGHTCPPDLYCGPRFLDATPDLSHALLESPVPLGASPAAKATVPPNSIYEWSGERAPSEQLHLISVLPGNASKEALPATGASVGDPQKSIRHSISADGSRVVFDTGGQSASGDHLYLRENANQPQSPIGAQGECLVAADACTVQLDGGLSGVPNFQTANAAVTRIFFTDGEDIDNEDLYEYNVEKSELVRMTTGAKVIASVIGASEDGSTIYFSGNGALAPHAVTGGCAPASSAPEKAASCNLYVMHYDGMHWQVPTLIAVLSALDNSDWSSSSGSYPSLAARVSPNGSWLAFMSRGRLTDYDNRDVASGEPDAEVYEYDDVTGSLVCASCNPTRSRPHGVAVTQIDTGNGGIAGGSGVFNGGWLAANLPGWTPLSNSSSIYQSRYLSDSGRLYFNSSDALAPKDTNNTEDVYEYEPGGDHGCSSASASGSVTFEAARSLQVEGRAVQGGAGCVGLISSGESSSESAFLDATETGSEVFFLTSAKLLPQDTDTSYDVYDARECTTDSPCPPAPAPAAPPCDNEASCKPAPTAQPDIFAPSGSATFSGPGNLLAPLPAVTASAPRKPLTRAQKLALALKACKKQKSRKKRTACEKQARSKYGAKPKAKAKNAGARKRSGR
jgi:hypothetical protein